MNVTEELERSDKRLFIDRPDEQNLFRTVLKSAKENFNSKNKYVLSYYGLWGIGKTTLLIKILDEMANHVKDISEENYSTFILAPDSRFAIKKLLHHLKSPKAAYINFKFIHDNRETLESLRQQLSDNYGFSFPLFDYGLYLYLNRIGKKSSAPEIKGVIDNSPFLCSVLDIMGSIPEFDIAAKLIRLGDQGLATFCSWLNNSKNTNDLTKTECQSPEALYKHLTVLFADDIEENLKNTNEPLVIILDSYEELVDELRDSHTHINNDKWIIDRDGLIRRIPNVLWVVASREELKWSPSNREWIKEIKECKLTGFLQKDAISFLNNAGIEDPTLVDGLCKLTNCNPGLLNLCIERYYDLKEFGKDICIDHFGKTIDELVENYIEESNDNRKYVIYLLSYLGLWTDEMIDKIGPELFQGALNLAYNTIKELSFIDKSDDGIYMFNPAFAKVYKEKCSNNDKIRINDLAISFYLNALADTEIPSKLRFTYAKELMKFALFKNDDDINLTMFYVNYIKEHIRYLASIGDITSANTIFCPFFDRAKKSYDSTQSIPSAYLYSEALFSLSRLQYRAGDFNNAYLTSRHGYILFNNLCSMVKTDDKRKFLELAEKTHIYVECLLAKGLYEEAYNVSCRSYDITAKTVGENSKAIMYPLSHMIDAATELYENDEKVLENALAYAETAISTYKELCKDDNDEERKSIEIASLMETKGTILYKLKRFDELKLIDNEVLAIREKWLGPNHPDTIIAKGNLQTCLYQSGDYDESLKLAQEIFKTRKKDLGSSHPHTIIAMECLAAALESKNRPKAALYYSKKVLQNRKNILGEEHPYTITAKINLAQMLGRMKYYSEALLYDEELLQELNHDFEKNHDQITKIEEHKAYCLNEMAKSQI